MTSPKVNSIKTGAKETKTVSNNKDNLLIENAKKFAEKLDGFEKKKIENDKLHLNDEISRLLQAYITLAQQAQRYIENPNDIRIKNLYIRAQKNVANLISQKNILQEIRKKKVEVVNKGKTKTEEIKQKTFAELQQEGKKQIEKLGSEFVDKNSHPATERVANTVVQGLKDQVKVVEEGGAFKQDIKKANDAVKKLSTDMDDMIGNAFRLNQEQRKKSFEVIKKDFNTVFNLIANVFDGLKKQIASKKKM